MVLLLGIKSSLLVVHSQIYKDLKSHVAPMPLSPVVILMGLYLRPTLWLILPRSEHPAFPQDFGPLSILSVLLIITSSLPPFPILWFDEVIAVFCSIFRLFATLFSSNVGFLGFLLNFVISLVPICLNLQHNPSPAYCP